jgi:hypothetical protein
VRASQAVAYDDLADRRFVLDYGPFNRLGNFKCVSRRRGMKCKNTVSHHGFAISRERQRIFRT